eukprot:CFRG0966T1
MSDRIPSQLSKTDHEGKPSALNNTVGRYPGEVVRDITNEWSKRITQPKNDNPGSSCFDDLEKNIKSYFRSGKNSSAAAVKEKDNKRKKRLDSADVIAGRRRKERRLGVLGIFNKGLRAQYVSRAQGADRELLRDAFSESHFYRKKTLELSDVQKGATIAGRDQRKLLVEKKKETSQLLQVQTQSSEQPAASNNLVQRELKKVANLWKEINPNCKFASNRIDRIREYIDQRYTVALMDYRLREYFDQRKLYSVLTCDTTNNKNIESTDNKSDRGLCDQSAAHHENSSFVRLVPLTHDSYRNKSETVRVCVAGDTALPMSPLGQYEHQSIESGSLLFPLSQGRQYVAASARDDFETFLQEQPQCRETAHGDLALLPRPHPIEKDAKDGRGSFVLDFKDRTLAPIHDPVELKEPSPCLSPSIDWLSMSFTSEFEPFSVPFSLF